MKLCSPKIRQHKHYEEMYATENRDRKRLMTGYKIILQKNLSYTIARRAFNDIV